MAIKCMKIRNCIELYALPNKHYFDKKKLN